MVSYRRFHWRPFNVLGRLAGAWFLFGGTLGVISVLVSWEDAQMPIVMLFLSAFLAVAGFLFLRVKPYRSDLDGTRSAFQEPVELGKRSWWTGEPRQ